MEYDNFFKHTQKIKTYFFFISSTTSSFFYGCVFLEFESNKTIAILTHLY